MLSPFEDPFLDSSNSSPNDVDTSFPPNNNVISHNVVPSSQDQRKQPLPVVDRLPSATNLQISQPSDALSIPVVQTAISRRSLSSQPSQHGRVLPSQHSLLVPQTVAAQAESSSQSLSIETEAQNQQELQSSQRGITPVLLTQNSATFLADRASSTANTDASAIPAGDQLATPAVQYPPIPSYLVSNLRPRPTDFARGDSVNDLPAENVSGAREVREHVQRLIDNWIEDAQTVLKFNGVFIPIVASFILESYKLLSPDTGQQISQQPSPPPAASIIIVNVMWLISLVLNITSTLFATSTLMLQWTGQPQNPWTPRDYMHSHSYLFLGTVSVFLFIAGLVIFFFTIHKIVGIVVLVVFIAVGLFEVVYLVLRPWLTRPLLSLSLFTIRR